MIDTYVQLTEPQQSLDLLRMVFICHTVQDHNCVKTCVQGSSHVAEATVQEEPESPFTNCCSQDYGVHKKQRLALPYNYGRKYIQHRTTNNDSTMQRFQDHKQYHTLRLVSPNGRTTLAGNVTSRNLVQNDKVRDTICVTNIHTQHVMNMILKID